MINEVVISGKLKELDFQNKKYAFLKLDFGNWNISLKTSVGYRYKISHLFDKDVIVVGRLCKEYIYNKETKKMNYKHAVVVKYIEEIKYDL